MFTAHPRPTWLQSQSGTPEPASSGSENPDDTHSGLPRVSIILLNWNQFEVTSACLRTLADLSGPTHEVIVVDQASENDEAERLKADFPWIRLIASPTNVGFTGGNNLAMQQAEGELVLLLNNDTEVPQSFLEPLVALFDSDPAVGVASPKIRYYDAPDVIQYAGCEGISEWTMRGHTIGYGEKDRGQYDIPREVDLAHGAAMMIRREVLEEIGLLATDFFIYYEEFDFCARAQRSGWTIRYVPSSLVLHKESVTVGKASPMKTEFMTRNRINFLRRNVAGIKGFVALGFVLSISTPVHLMRHLLAGRKEHVRAMIKGLLWHAKPRSVLTNERLAPKASVRHCAHTVGSNTSHSNGRRAAC